MRCVSASHRALFSLSNSCWRLSIMSSSWQTTMHATPSSFMKLAKEGSILTWSRHLSSSSSCCSVPSPSCFGALDFPLIDGARYPPALDTGWLDASIAGCGGLVGLSPLGFQARGARGVVHIGGEGSLISITSSLRRVGSEYAIRMGGANT
jgi:hypothetical protein